MSNDFKADIAAMVQADVEGRQPGASTAPVVTPAPSAPPQAGAAATTSSTTPAPAATTAAPGTLGGKFKNEEEAIKAHHLLIHNLNAVKAENDKLLARLAAPEVTAAAPLTPGRVDPSQAQGRTADSEDEKWREQYGIAPEDIDARIERRLKEVREAEMIPARAMQAADAYMAQAHPEFLTKVDEVKAFVLASPTLKERVAALWAGGLFAEAMEIGWLAYDNTLRTTQIAQADAAATTAQVGRERGDATMLSSQAGGARETVSAPDAYPRTPEDWARIRAMKAAGKDEEVRRILFGPLIAHIPELNPGMQR